MKKSFLITISICVSLILRAQTPVFVSCSAGTLSTQLTATQLSTTTNLMIFGSIDASDFKVLRDNMPLLSSLDISNTTIVAYMGSMGPGQGYSYPANTIPQYAFNGKTSLTSITIPSSVTTIDVNAFYNCSNLTSYSNNGQTSGITSIGNFAFYGCTKLYGLDVQVVSKLTSIGNCAFYNCSSIVNFTIPSTLTYLGYAAFYGCASLAYPITIPEGISIIDQKTFYGCVKLCEVYVPSTVVEIHQSSFGYCTAWIYINKKNTTYVQENGLLMNKAKTTLYECATQYMSVDRYSIVVPKTITTLADFAFAGCKDIKNLILPSSITSYGSESFSGMVGLQHLYVYKTTAVYSAWNTTFKDFNFSACVLHVPYGSLSSYTSSILWKSFTNIQESIYDWGVSAGKLSSNLTTTQKSTTTDIILTGSIDARDFKTMRDSMLNLKAIDITNTTIAAYSGNLGTVVGAFDYPKDGIPQNAFSSSLPQYTKNGLIAIDFPTTITSIGKSAFHTITELRKVSFPATLTRIEENAFSDIFRLAQVDLPNSLEYIGNSAFSNHTYVSKFIIPSSVTHIGSNAFSAGTNYLTEIYAEHSFPINLESSAFTGINKTSCKLYVPYGSKTRYQKANQWKDFNTMVEATTGFYPDTNVVGISYVANTTINVNIFANVAWTASSNKSWLTITSTNSSSGNATLVLSSTLNDGLKREAILTISSIGYSNQYVKIIQSAKQITWNGIANVTDLAYWPNNILPSSVNTILVESGELTIITDITFGEIIISPNAKLTVNENEILNIQGDILLQSNISGSASVFEKGTLTVNGTTTVQQYLTCGRNWYIASPVSTANSSVIKSTSGNKLWSNNESAQTWDEITNATTTLSTMNGYVANVSTSGNVTFTGSLNTGTKTINLSRTGTVNTSRGFNLIGNPYPSCVNWKMATKTNLEPTIWYRTKNANSTYVFDTYNADLHIGTNNNGNGAVTQYIPPMQAVWTRVNTDGATGILTFDNSMRSHPNNNILKSETEISNIRLKVSNDKNSDETIIVFNENASNSFDNYDSEKMFGSNKDLPELYTIADAEKLVINGLESVAKNSNIPLGFKTAKAGTFTISANEINGLDGIPVILEDKLLNKTQDLTQTTSYTFASDSVNDTTRFAIRLKTDNGPYCCGLYPIEEIGVNNIDDNSIAVFAKGNSIIINSTDINNGTASVFNLLGQEIVTSKITGTTTVLTESISAGTYFVKIEKGKTVVTKKIIIE